MAAKSAFRLPAPAAWVLLWMASTSTILSWLGNPFREDFFVDEIHWLGSAYYHHLAWEKFDWHLPDWQMFPARENPPVTKYLIGLTLAANGQHVENLNLLGAFYLVFEGRPKAWGGPEDRAKRVAVIDRMDPTLRDQIRTYQKLSLAPDIIRPARLLMLACGAGTSLIVLLWGWQFLPPLLALVASQALLLHPAVTQAYNHAMADAPALLLSTAAAFLVFRWAREFEAEQVASWRGPGRAVAAGAVLALACGAKMNSLLVGLAGLATGLTLVVTAAREPGRPRLPRLLAEGAILGLTALGLFVAINPALWPHPVDGLLATYFEHARSAQIQAEDYGIGLTTISARLRTAADLATFGFTLLGLLTAGAIAGLRHRRKGFRDICRWWLVAAPVLIFWLPLPRLRYVVPLVAPAVLLACGLVAIGWEELSAFLETRPSGPG